MEDATFIVKELLPIDRPNRNGRIYSRSCAEQIVNDFNERKPILGELDSPHGLEPQVNLDRISHSVEDVFIEGDFLKAKVRVLDTPMGNIAGQLKEGGVDLKLAMRGTGEVHPTGYINNYDLITVDIVSQSSTLTKTDLVDQIGQIMDSMDEDGLL